MNYRENPISREDFYRILAQTIQQIDGLTVREPDRLEWSALQRPLHAMREATAGSRQPSPEEIERVGVGSITNQKLEPILSANYHPGLSADLEDLVIRLLQLEYHWKTWHGKASYERNSQQTYRGSSPTASWDRRWKGRLMIAGIVATLSIAGGIIIWMLQIRSDHGSPTGDSIRGPNQVATLIATLEPYMVSLHHDPTVERSQIDLFLHPTDGHSSDRKIKLASGLRYTGASPGLRLLGDDGRFVWFLVNGIGAWDRKEERLITVDDLRRANPSLRNLPEGEPSNNPYVPKITVKPLAGTESRELFSDDLRRYSFGKRLRVLAPNYRDAFEVDPESLQASPAKSDDGRKPQFPVTVASFLANTEAPKEFLDAAYVRGEAGAQPIRLTAPDGFLMVHTSKVGLAGTLLVSRVDLQGKPVWTSDTGIDRFTLQQILPDANLTAFIGARPPTPGKVSEPILVIVNQQTGVVAATSLWQ